MAQGGSGVDATTSKYRGAQGMDPAFIKKLEQQFGFDKPAYDRFGIMLWNYIRFDFGSSYFRDVTVLQLIKARDGTTGQSLLEAFEPADQPLLEAISAKVEGKTARQKNPYPKGSLAFAAWVVASLGGWDGYYGKPGPKTMSIGLEAFMRIKFGATLRLQDV